MYYVYTGSQHCSLPVPPKQKATFGHIAYVMMEVHHVFCVIQRLCDLELPQIEVAPVKVTESREDLESGR